MAVEFFGSPDNSDFAKVDAFGILNLRVGVSGELGANNVWDVTLWGTNVLDEAYVVGGLGAGNFGSVFRISRFAARVRRDVPRDRSLIGAPDS